VSFALGPNDLYQRTFHPTSVAGTFGAAVAAARLLGANSEQLERTLGLAATEANGLLAWASDESEESRPLNPGLAARNGVTAARLAMLGFGAPVGVFDPEAKYNVFRAWSLDGRGNPLQLVDGFGRTFAIMGLTIKQHACCAFLHPAVDGLLDIMRAERLAPRDISAMTIRFPRAGSPMIDDNPLRSHRAQYMLPVAAVRGHVSFDDVIHDRSSEEDVQRLSGATTFIQDEDLDHFYPERYATIIEIGTPPGTTFSRRIDWARGTPENPMTAEEIVAKFRTLAGQRLDQARVDQIVSLVSALDRSPTLTEVLRLLTVPVAGQAV
jgi:2-methylcitrate dehydratase PrpD